MSRNVLTALVDLQSRLHEQSTESTEGVVVLLPNPWWAWFLDDVRASLNGVSGQESVVINLPCGPITVRQAK